MGIPILGDIIEGVIGKAGDIASEFIVDKDKKAQLQFELERLKIEAFSQAEQRAHEQLTGQMEINKIEAGHRSIFVAGWRPFIGWVSGAGVAWTFVIGPLVEWVSRLFGWAGTMPVLDVGQLMTLVLAMLGMGAMRTIDKRNGTSNDVLPIRKAKEPTNLLPQVFAAPPEKVPWET